MTDVSLAKQGACTVYNILSNDKASTTKTVGKVVLYIQVYQATATLLKTGCMVYTFWGAICDTNTKLPSECLATLSRRFLNTWTSAIQTYIQCTHYITQVFDMYLCNLLTN